MKLVTYTCDCGNTINLNIIEKGDTILIQDESGNLEKLIVEDPWNYPPCPEACPECNFCPPEDLMEKVSS